MAATEGTTNPMVQSLFHPGRVMQLILRDANDVDLIVLDICGPEMGGQGICLLSGFTGFMHAPRTPVRESWAYQEGSTPSDFPRVDERLLDFRLATKGDTPELWETIDSLLWEVLGFKHDCYLRYYTADRTSWREIKIRLDRKPSDTITYDPSVTKHMVWAITAVACDPWWYSTTLVSTWTNTDGSGIGNLILQNDADQECWVQFASNTLTSTQTWTLPDSVMRYPVGHPKAGQNVTHTLPALGVGQEFLVDTYPLHETLTVMDGSLQWAKMRAEDFLYSIPAHTPPTQVPVKVVGGTTASSVSAFMTQRWDRPFGGGRK